MRTAAEERAYAANVEQVCEHMRRLRLSLNDLVDFGGEDLRSPDPHRAGKARSVEKTWALMARLSVQHVDLDDPALPLPVSKPPRRRHRKPAEKHQPYQRFGENQPSDTKLNEINDLSVCAAVGVSEASLGDIREVVS
jgi:hypothetical protein